MVTRKKYKIVLSEKYVRKSENGKEWFQFPVNISGQLVAIQTIIPLDPYTEPDMEQVRKEAYEQGLSDAWEAARKIQDTGGNLSWWIHNVSPSGAIDKIRQYEQKKEEIKVGNEIKGGNERYVVLQKYLNNIDEPMAVLFNRRDGKISVFHLYNGNGAIFEKTGKNFPEIVEVLQKMKGEA